MNKKEILTIIKTDNSGVLDKWLQESGDFNSMIYRKSLIEHALINKAKACSRVLLLHGADCSHSKRHEHWLEMVSDEELKMIDEMESYRDTSYLSTIQIILNNLSLEFLGPHPLSYRDVFSYESGEDKVILCGLHYFEHISWDFLTKTVKEGLQCHYNFEGKYVMIVSVLLKKDIDDLPPTSERIYSFLSLRQIRGEDLDRVLDAIKGNEDEHFIGIHFSDDPLIESLNAGLDLSQRFYKSMKEVMEKKKRPVTFSMKHKFTNISSWSHDLNRWVNEFKEVHGVYPNIILASDSTYARIDMVANTNGRDNIRNPDGEIAEKFASMSGFQGKGYSLDFCIDDRLDVDMVKLIFDSDPGGDGEPIFDDQDFFDAVAG